MLKNSIDVIELNITITKFENNRIK